MSRSFQDPGKGNYWTLRDLNANCIGQASNDGSPKNLELNVEDDKCRRTRVKRKATIDQSSDQIKKVKRTEYLSEYSNDSLKSNSPVNLECEDRCLNKRNLKQIDIKMDNRPRSIKNSLTIQDNLLQTNLSYFYTNQLNQLNQVHPLIDRNWLINLSNQLVNFNNVPFTTQLTVEKYDQLMLNALILNKLLSV